MIDWFALLIMLAPPMVTVIGVAIAIWFNERYWKTVRPWFKGTSALSIWEYREWVLTALARDTLCSVQDICNVLRTELYFDASARYRAG